MSKKMMSLGWVLALGVCAVPLSGQVITTIAGGGWRPFPTSNMPAISAPLGTLFSPTLDSQGNIYASDSYNNVVVRISPSGTLTLVAGNSNAGFSGDGGPATNALLSGPKGVAVDSAGNLYIADYGNHRIRKVSNGIITTVAGNGLYGFAGDGGPATSASLYYPVGVAVDTAGNIYIADQFNGRIREVSAADGSITTVAGNGGFGFSGDGGLATRAELNNPYAVAVDAAGSLYIDDWYNNRIRKVSGGVITTVAGSGLLGFSGDGGSATAAALNRPTGVAVDANGQIFIADFSNERVRKVSSGTITTVAGTGQQGFSGDNGSATNATLDGPGGVVVDAAGNLYIADFFNERIRKVAAGVITTVAGQGAGTRFGDGGPATSAGLLNTISTAVDDKGNIYIADYGNNVIRKISGGTITTVAGNGNAGYSGDGGLATSASINGPEAVALDSAGNLYIAEYGNSRVRKVSGGTISTVVGTGVAGFSGDGAAATSAEISHPVGLTLDSAGNLYIADNGNSLVRKVSGGTISTVAGNRSFGYSGDGGAATSATLNGPGGLAVDAAGNLYIGDYGNMRVRKVSGSTITTVAGNGTAGYSGDQGPATSAELDLPSGIAIDTAGNLYIADSLNNVIRKVSNGIISTVVGNGLAGFYGDGGPATSAWLENPVGVTVDSAGNLYVADTYNYRVREVLNTAPSYSVSSTSLTFSASAGGSPTGTQGVSLSSTVPGLGFLTAVSASWLNVTLSGSTVAGQVAYTMPAVVAVSADPSNLTAGTYQGTVTITAPFASPSTTTIAVTLTVLPGTPAVLGTDTQNISFTAAQGSSALTQQLHVVNTGGGSLSFTVNASTTSGSSWLAVSPANGTATPSSSVALTVTATPGSLTPGTYSGTIAITGGGSTINVPVTLSVSAPTAVILVSQSALSFTAVAQGGVPLPGSFGILNVGQGSMNWTAAASTLSGGNWLQISPTSATVQRPYLDVSLVNISVNASSLAAGTYYGQIQVAAAAANTPQVITVIVKVMPAGFTLGPQMFPSGLIFTGVAGVTPGSQDVMVGNASGTPVSYQSGIIGTSFSFLPTNANVAPTQPTTLRVYPDYSSVTPGTIQQGTITLQFSDRSPSQTVNVLMVVAPSGTTASAVGKEVHGGALVPEASSGCATQALQIQFRSLQPNFTAVVGQPTTVDLQVSDGCGNLVASGASVSAAASNGDPSVPLNAIGGGVWQGTWQPSNAAGSVVMHVAAYLQQGNLGLVGTATLTGTVNPPAPSVPTPTVLAQGVAHAATLQPGVPIAPGGLITIKGTNLAVGNSLTTSTTWPVQVNGTQVMLGNQALPILYASPGQLNVQVPYTAPVNTQYQLTVQNGNSLSVPQSLAVAPAQPGIFTLNQDGTGQGDVFRSDGITLAQPGTPASIGETVVIYCTGLGAVSPAVAAGSPAPTAEPLARTVNTVTVTIGGQPAQVSYSGLTPGYAGLYQINAAVPSGITTGDAVTVVIGVAGQTSPPVTMAVQ